MNHLIFARMQMAISLAFHIIFAVLGIGMPLLMAIAEGTYLRTGQTVYLELSKRWAKATAILFAIGAVSGTVLSFELGLLWPSFMEHAGGIIGMPFSLEGFAFFTEAIFLGIYLYGWNRIRPRAHWWAGLLVAFSGMLSAVFVVTANAWMNTPAGFKIVGGQWTEIDPIAAMLNPASTQQIIHQVLAAYVATGFGLAGVHAYRLLRAPDSLLHRKALTLALALGLAAIPLQVLSGDFIGRMVAAIQPVKFAALEAQYRTEAGVGLTIGGIPDDADMTVRYGLRIPRLLSLLTHHDPGATIQGLETVPRDQWPNTRIVHCSFDLMVLAGFILLAVAVWTAAAWRRRRSLPLTKNWLRILVATGPLGFLAIEAGWCVTEFGRQPWIIVGVMRTSDAVTPMPWLEVPFTLFTAVYLFLSGVLIALLRREFLTRPRDENDLPGGER